MGLEGRLSRIREELRARLEALGFSVAEDWTLSFREPERVVLARLAEEANPRPNPRVERYFATPLEVFPERIRPVIRPVEGRLERAIFRHALSFWKVPVSMGYGRKLHFIVWDDWSGKVMGILGLSDPVIGLRVRDDHIGWDGEAKRERLYHVMTANVLGAVPPYNGGLKGSKLVALLARGSTVRACFRDRYEGKASVILGKKRRAELVLLDTTGAFGKTAIYNGLVYRGLKLWRHVGYTQGLTHTHLSVPGIFGLLKEAIGLLGEDEVLKRNRYGDGPNWKIRVVKKALSLLGIPPERLMMQGIRRGYYVSPLAENWREFLRGEEEAPRMVELSDEELIEYWKARWLPRG